MDYMKMLQEELEQWEAKCEQARKKFKELKIINMDTSDKLEDVEKELKALEQEAKNLDEQVHRQRLSHEEELFKLEEENRKLQDMAAEQQRTLDSANDAYKKVQESLQISEQLPSTNINFIKEVSPAKNADGISYICDITSSKPYVLQGGQALLTFQDEQVARSIISRRRHTVQMDDTTVAVKAGEPILERNVKFEINMNISDTKIQVCKLPDCFCEDEEKLKDKVELAFYKSAVGGGEIQAVDYDKASKSAYVTYLQRGVAQRVLQTEDHCIKIWDVSHYVNVKPCIQLQLDKLQMISGTFSRSVLLTDIENIMDKEEDEIQDHLEIHFQRSSSGGGEIEAIVFSKEDKKMLIFQEDKNEPINDPNSEPGSVN